MGGVRRFGGGAVEHARALLAVLDCRARPTGLLLGPTTLVVGTAAALALCFTLATEDLGKQQTGPTAQLETQPELRPALKSEAEVAASVPNDTIAAPAGLFSQAPFATWTLFPLGRVAHPTRVQVSEASAELVATDPQAEGLPEESAEPQLAPVPLPPSRPVLASEPAEEPSALASSPTAEKTPGFFEKLFGFGRLASLPAPAEATGRTAVYDISARAVFLPNGERLEAHSGLREFLDDVRHVHVKSRGPTPPNTYQLTLRESLFHGVQAIRLTPVGSGNMYGRAGILAHPYMLGPDGSSNGCVSIQNYPKFLEAFQKGQINQLIVVAGSSPAGTDVQAAASTPDRRFAAY
jgi:hypothetical protein